MMNSLDLSVIIINWKSQAFVRKCLASLCSNDSALACEIFVVDNASYDGCEEMVKSEFPHVTFIQSEHNLGFAAANNLAFSQSCGRNVMFLNPDTEIQGAAVQTLIASLESIPDAGMVGAHLLNSDLSLQTTCITALPSILNQALSSDHLRKAFPTWKTWGMKALFEKNRRPVQVEAISGACMLAKREILEQVGCFSTDYFMYSEDMDLCVKVSKTGWKIYYVSDAMIIHHAGGSSASREESNFSSIMLRESLAHYFEVHRGRMYAAIYRSSTAFVSMCRISLLMAISPLAIHPRGYRFLSRTVRKWGGILAWSLGRTVWASQQPIRPAVLVGTSQTTHQEVS